MDEHRIAQRDPHCEEEILDGEIVLYTADSARAVYLNPSAALVWGLIDGQRRIGEISDLLRAVYPDASALDNDILATIQHLEEQGLVRFP